MGEDNVHYTNPHSICDPSRSQGLAKSLSSPTPPSYYYKNVGCGETMFIMQILIALHII